MWKQKLKICGINLAAYSVVLIIMAMLSVCSRLYGQESLTLSLDRTKRIVSNIDTTKQPFFEYGKSFLSPHSGYCTYVEGKYVSNATQPQSFME